MRTIFKGDENDFKSTIINSVNEGDAMLSVQLLQHREVAELRWDGAIELIRVEVPERAAMTQ